MTRGLAASATLALPLLLVLPGCGGGGGPSEAPQSTTTVAPAKPTTTTVAAGKAEEEAAPLLAWADGTPDSNEANPKHTYAKAGKYRADLSVSDSPGDSDTDYIEIEVR